MKIMEKRRSVRTFKEKPIETNTRKDIVQFLKKLEREYAGKYKFPIVDSKASGKIGTYGVIKGAQTYIGGVLLQEGNLVELGFMFQKIMLYLNTLNLGNCWLGGTFRRTEFMKTMNLNEEDRLLILTPVGYAEEKMSLKEKSMRTLAKSDKRMDFDELFFNDSMGPLYLYNLKEFQYALEMIRIGPSASNKQPWRVVKVDDNYHFYLKRTKDYAKNLDYDIQMLDLGIAMFNFQTTLDMKSISGDFSVLKHPRRYDKLEYIATWSPADGETYKF